MTTIPPETVEAMSSRVARNVCDHFLNQVTDWTAWHDLPPEQRVEIGLGLRSVIVAEVSAALSALPAPSPAAEGWALVPREPTEEMIQAGLGALSEWRKGLSSDEAVLRRSAPVQSGRVWLASATPEEKAVIRWRAMIAAAPPPLVGEAKP